METHWFSPSCGLVSSITSVIVVTYPRQETAGPASSTAYLPSSGRRFRSVQGCGIRDFNADQYTAGRAYSFELI